MNNCAEDYEKLTVPQLKDQLRSRGLPLSGNKAALVQRLLDDSNHTDEKTILESNSSSDDSSLVTLDVPEEDVLGLSGSVQSEPAKDRLPEIPSHEKPSATTTADSTKSVKSPVKAPSTQKVSTNISISIRAKKQESSNAQSETTASDDVQSVTKITLAAESDLDDVHRKMERAKKFSTEICVDDRKALRAERFGIKSASMAAGKISRSGITTDPEILKKRVERFGSMLNSNQTGKPSSQSDVLHKRAERFGQMGDAQTHEGSIKLGSEDNEKLLKRKERFGPVTVDAEVELKKQKRLERFKT